MRDRGGAYPPLVELTLARLREFLREPEALFWVFVFPMLMACALGVAFRARGDEPVVVGVVERRRRSAVTATLQRDAAASTVRDAGAGRGRASAPARRRAGRRRARHAARSITSIRRAPRAGWRGGPSTTLLQRAAGRGDAFAAREAPIEAIGSRYIDWLMPGLLGMNIMSTGLWGIGFSIVQARTRKLLKRLIATPMRRRDYLLAQMFGRLVFLVHRGRRAAALRPLRLRRADARVALRCSSAPACSARAFGGLGLLVASRARTIEAVSGLMNLVMLPMWVLSGVFFSASNFPAAMQPFIQALPLTALNDALRAVMLEGAAAPEVVAANWRLLAAWGLVSFVVALRIFRWR